MTSSATLQHFVAGDLADATSVNLQDSTGAKGIVNNGTGSIVVTPTATITPTSLGTYVYDMSALGGGNYTVYWRVEYPPSSYTFVTQIVSIDDQVSLAQGITLAAIERAAALRLGPYDRVKVTTGSTSTFVVARRRSSLSIGGYKDKWVLRRGYKWDGAVVPNFNAEDRIRVCSDHNPTDGEFTVDEPYAVDPAVDEAIEFHHINPDTLREAALAGLARCYFYDRVSLATTAAAAERDISTPFPYITDPSQVKRVYFTYTGDSLNRPKQLRWFKSIFKDGGVYLQSVADPYPNTVDILVRRPHSSYVNGGLSVTGPDDDDDILNISLAYAAAAVHIECWRIARPYLAGPAQAGMTTSQKDAASEFTKQSFKAARQKPPILIQHSDSITYEGIETN